MAIPETTWGEYISNMYDNGFRDLRRTGHYRALNETLDRMESDCKINFCEDDFIYIDSWIDALLAVNSAESCFMYERGYQDCVAILKQLEII